MVPGVGGMRLASPDAGPGAVIMTTTAKAPAILRENRAATVTPSSARAETLGSCPGFVYPAGAAP